MSIQALSSVKMFNADNNSAIDKSGAQTATDSDSGNMGVMTSGTTGGTATGVVRQASSSKGPSTSNADIYYDIRDTNKDGIVSAQEEYQYALTHFGRATTSQVEDATNKLQAVTLYNQQGSLRVNTNMIAGLINLSV